MDEVNCRHLLGNLREILSQEKSHGRHVEMPFDLLSASTIAFNEAVQEAVQLRSVLMDTAGEQKSPNNLMKPSAWAHREINYRQDLLKLRQKIKEQDTKINNLTVELESVRSGAAISSLEHKIRALEQQASAQQLAHQQTRREFLEMRQKNRQLVESSAEASATWMEILKAQPSSKNATAIVDISQDSSPTPSTKEAGSRSTSIATEHLSVQRAKELLALAQEQAALQVHSRTSASGNRKSSMHTDPSEEGKASTGKQQQPSQCPATVDMLGDVQTASTAHRTEDTLDLGPADRVSLSVEAVHEKEALRARVLELEGEVRMVCSSLQDVAPVQEQCSLRMLASVGELSAAVDAARMATEAAEAKREIARQVEIEVKTRELRVDGQHTEEPVNERVDAANVCPVAVTADDGVEREGVSATNVLAPYHQEVESKPLIEAGSISGGPDSAPASHVSSVAPPTIMASENLCHDLGDFESAPGGVIKDENSVLQQNTSDSVESTLHATAEQELRIRLLADLKVEIAAHMRDRVLTELEGALDTVLPDISSEGEKKQGSLDMDNGILNSAADSDAALMGLKDVRALVTSRLGKVAEQLRARDLHVPAIQEAHAVEQREPVSTLAESPRENHAREQKRPSGQSGQSSGQSSLAVDQATQPCYARPEALEDGETAKKEATQLAHELSAFERTVHSLRITVEDADNAKATLEAQNLELATRLAQMSQFVSYKAQHPKHAKVTFGAWLSGQKHRQTPPATTLK